MPKLTVEGVGEFEVPANKRLVLALEDEAKVDQLHACGGNARCTTCRVEFVAGEPDKMTEAEKTVFDHGVGNLAQFLHRRTGFGRFRDGFLSVVDDLVDLSLLFAEFAIDRERARHVRRVMLVFGTDVHQQ